MNIYDVLETIDTQKDNVLITALDEGEQGEKCLLTDGKCVWTSKEALFSELIALVLEENVLGLLQHKGKQYFVEKITGEKHLVICGGGHVSMPVISVGLMLGFRVTVIEDRPMFAEKAREQGAHRVICKNYEEALAEVEGDANTFFVIVTRGHRYDKECLRGILPKKYAYLGMIGSRRRVVLVKETMEQEGFAKEKIDAMHSPIGLDIGAETPAEIAVAILAEIIQVKNRQSGDVGLTLECKKAIQKHREAGESLVMATIIKRQGSAPRGVGAKMLVKRDGSAIGTIGGGSAEAEIMKMGQQMLLSGQKQMQMPRVDMHASGTAEDDGMVCGGVIDILLEYIDGEKA